MSTEPLTSVELPAEPASVAADRRRGLLFVALAVAGVAFTMHLQIGLSANFRADVMHLGEDQVGLLEALREMWGILALGILALVAGLAEPLLGAGVLVLMGLGLGTYAFVPTFFWLVMAAMVWSPGFHVWVPLPNSMTLALAEPGQAGHRVGQIRAAGAVGAGAGLVAALVLYHAKVEIRPMYVLAGAASILAGAACLGIPRKIKTPGPRLVWRRKYWRYYLLHFLEGWRKQIFVAFAGFLLVRGYGTGLGTILILLLCVQPIRWVTSPLVGRLIDRVGERPVLVLYFAGLTALFVGYALVRNVYVLYAIFVIDGALFVLAMALTTYVNRIAPPVEHTATLSMGVAFNHVGAVAMPLAGGLIWKFFGYHWTFLIGAAAAVASVLVALLIPPRRREEAERPGLSC